MNDSLVFQKSKIFADRVIRLYQKLSVQQREFVISTQLLRCGTSIGANLAEAKCAISKKDFYSKNNIAYSECTECQYWLEKLVNNGYITQEEYDSIRADCDEIGRMLSSITSTLKERLPKKDYGY
jgi:four helix bundle protein